MGGGGGEFHGWLPLIFLRSGVGRSVGGGVGDPVKA